MSSPSRQELAEAILILSDKMSDKKLTETVAAFLVENRRSGELDAIMREVSRQREQRDQVTEVTATSAFTLNDGARKAIKSLLGNNKLIINEVVDAEMLGGVRLETSELQLDLTVRNRLSQLKAAAN
jgi:F0F1-type ATP synthase delta subunit